VILNFGSEDYGCNSAMIAETPNARAIVQGLCISWVLSPSIHFDQVDRILFPRLPTDPENTHRFFYAPSSARVAIPFSNLKFVGKFKGHIIN